MIDRFANIYGLRRITFPILLLCLAAVPLRSDMIPDAPVTNFRLPMFNEEGIRVWNLSGEEGRYIDEHEVEVSGMNLTIFSEAERDRVQARILSPEATMFVQRNQAAGTERIEMEGDHYLIHGREWQWDGEEKRLTIDEDVQVLFFEDISGLFR